MEDASELRKRLREARVGMLAVFLAAFIGMVMLAGCERAAANRVVIPGCSEYTKLLGRDEGGDL